MKTRLGVLFFLVFSTLAHALEAPPCLDQNRTLTEMNQAVLGWKDSTKSGYQARARVSGRVTRITRPDKDHMRFEIQIGSTQNEVLEVIYNQDFGALDAPKPGQQVEACGVYITSNKRNGSFPPSPSGAIIHWVHYNPGDRDGGKHEHGYVMIEGRLFGMPSHIVESLKESVR
jgi:hypothetical protein